MELAMLGVGNGFSPGVYDNNALIKNGEQEAMIDCGTTAWVSLNQMKIPRKKISEIFLTHLHFDHSGGVESAALYSKYMWGQKIRLIVPQPIRERLWDCVLKGTIENRGEGLNSLEDYFQVTAPAEGETFTFCNMKARWIATKHIEGKFSCSLILEERFLYTSDMRCNRELLEEMHKRGIEIIFHDCQLKNAAVHSDFQELCTYPDYLQEKIYLMHHGLSVESSIPESGKMRFLFQQQWMKLW